MKDRFGITLLFALLLALAACRVAEEDLPTSEPGYVSISNELLTVSLPDLAGEPEAYEGAYLQIEGLYRHLPRLFCSDDPYPAPTNWMLTSGDIQIQAAGFDSQLRSLMANDLKMTVNGRWQRWQGLVGCGQRAVQQEIWYLQVDEIVSPDPIVLVTLTPAGSSNQPGAVQPTSVMSTTAQMETTTASPISEQTETPASGTPVPTTTVGIVSETSTPTTIPLSPTPSPSLVVQGTPTVSSATSTSPSTTTTPGGNITATATATGGTASPTSTGTLSAISPTATSMSPTATGLPSATATFSPSDFIRIDQGDIIVEELVASFLESRQIHSWSFTIDASDTVTVSAAMPSSGDIVLAIYDESGNLVTEHNQAAAGHVETLAGFPLARAGTYQLEVRTVDGSANPYSMILLQSSSYAFVAQKILDYGASELSTLAEESDHFWFFEGETGDIITFTVTPIDTGDLFLELYGADGDSISDFIDEGAGGEQELLRFELVERGMYTLRVGEYEFQQSNYQISLTRN